MSEELSRSFRFLKENAVPAPSFLSYEVIQVDSRSISASLGALIRDKSGKTRWLDVAARVGSPALEADGQTPGAALTYEDTPAAIRHALWLETDRAYRAAAKRSTRVESGGAARVEDAAVSRYPAVRREIPPAPPEFDASSWMNTAIEVSARFREHPRILASRVDVTVDNVTRYLTNTEGTRLIHGRGFVGVRISAESRASDGEALRLAETFEAADSDGLRNKDELIAAADRIAADLTRLLDAPAAEPFTGPAIFSARAAGAFFHELLGRRLEAGRSKTAAGPPPFAVDGKVLPDFLSVAFDPTRRQAAGVELNGWYEYDDEGVKARRVVAVEHGVVRTLLRARSPLDGPDGSNGHGRKEPGMPVAARQSNLIVDAAGAVPEAKLRDMLIAETRRQHKPYGLFFRGVAGDRGALDAGIVYRVYPDGRPDELIRGVELAAPPAASLLGILAAGDRREALNLHSEGDSGSVPVSVVAPSILVSEIAVTRRPHTGAPPLLPPPPLSSLPGGRR